MAKRGARRHHFESPTDKGFMAEMRKQFSQALKNKDQIAIEKLRPLVS